MNGRTTFNSLLNRRNFLLSASATALSVTAISQQQRLLQLSGLIATDIQVRSHDQSEIGHRLRTNFYEKDYVFSHNEHLSIFGAGISGLSCAYFLTKNNISDFSIYDLGPMAGGNSAYFTSDISNASWGAHYLPLPSPENKELLQFLFEHQIITGWKDGLPIYDEMYLCHDPKERLFIHGSWQESLLPNHGLPTSEKSELVRFHELTEKLKWKKGNDGLWIFDIPLDRSSQDSEFISLDQISFFDWLHQNNFNTSSLLWLCNYACLDDFGTDVHKTSAWAGLHYFSSRRPQQAGQSGQNHQNDDEVLVWPEGNGFLKDQLESTLKKPVHVNTLVRKVLKNGRGFRIFFEAVNSDRKFYVDSDQIVYSLPRYTAPYILGENYRLSNDGIEYHPWLVAHIKIKKTHLENFSELSWDTVKYTDQYREAGLGYINNNHQTTNPNEETVLITTYHAFSDSKGSDERQKLRELSKEDIKNFVVSELAKIHPKIHPHIESIDYKILGHAMISPQINFIWKNRFQKLPREHQGIVFAHSDMSGMSIFEEAFYQGQRAFDLLKKQGRFQKDQS